MVLFEDPTLPTRVVEGFGPVAWAYDLVRSLLQGYAGDRPTYVQNVRVGAVAPAYIGGPAIVVRVGQTAQVVEKKRRSERKMGFEPMTLTLEGRCSTS